MSDSLLQQVEQIEREIAEHQQEVDTRKAQLKELRDRLSGKGRNASGRFTTPRKRRSRKPPNGAQQTSIPQPDDPAIVQREQDVPLPGIAEADDIPL